MNILLLEDNMSDVQLVKEELKKLDFKFTTKNVDTKEDFISALHDYKPNIILSDYSLKQFTGFEALEITLKHKLSIPFIIVTGSLSEETAADSIKRGAWDYVLKDNLVRLPSAIKNALKLKREKDKNEIAERKLIELYRATEQSPVTVIMTDIEGNIEYVNPKFTEVTGYTFEEVIGQNPRLLKSGKHDDKFYKNLWETITSGKNWTGEFYNKKKNGELFWESASISPIRDNNNVITNFVGVKEDISEKKKMINDVLQAKKDAENADKMKSIFLAQMSHEIRTPINAMIGMATLIKYDLKETASEDTLKSFEIIDRAGGRIVRTIDLLLNLSEIQAGTYKPTPSFIDLHVDILAQIVADKMKIALKKGVDLGINIATDDTTVVADAYTVNQIFIQLIDNAIKYTNKGEVRINIRRNHNGSLIIEVEDTGIGIEDNYLSKMFEPFTQEEMGYTRKYEGNGIGLALVKTYSEINKAKVEVESVKGIGSTFRVIF